MKTPAQIVSKEWSIACNHVKNLPVPLLGAAMVRGGGRRRAINKPEEGKTVVEVQKRTKSDNETVSTDGDGEPAMLSGVGGVVAVSKGLRGS